MLIVAGLSGCGEERAPVDPVMVEGLAMGTSWRLVVAGDTAGLESLVAEELERCERLFSNWREDSEVSRINAAGGVAAVSPSAEMAALLEMAEEVRLESGGAFDERILEEVNKAGFGPGMSAPAVGIDLGGIAKGWAVDAVVAVLTAEGCENLVFELGGEIRAVGPGREGDGWRIGVEAPDPVGRRIGRKLLLRDRAMATSGNYRQLGERNDDGWASHLLDPETGLPVVRELGSVTVIAKTCAAADAWATALYVIGQGGEADRLAREQGLEVEWNRGAGKPGP